MIDEARFHSHVMLEDDEPDACWVWVGAMRYDGRGRFHGIPAHWAAWELQHGEPVPANSRLRQVCRHPNCVRHWKLAGPVRKLTSAAVMAIRTSPLSGKALARRYRVSYQAISYHRKRASLPPHNGSYGGV